MEQRLGELKRYVRGWMGYYGLASQLKLFASLEQCQYLFLQKTWVGVFGAVTGNVGDTFAHVSVS